MLKCLTTCPECKGKSCLVPKDEYPNCLSCNGDHKPRWIKRIRRRLNPLFGFCGCGWPDKILGWWLPTWLHRNCAETLDLVDF